MNSLSKFTLMMAFTTAIFCLLMLSKGFASPTARHEQYFFMGQSQIGRVILSLEMEQKIGSGTSSVVRMFTERDGWVQIRRSEKSNPSKQLGEKETSVMRNDSKGAFQWQDAEHDLMIELNANEVGINEENHQLAYGLGKIRWNGNTLSGTVIHQRNKSANLGTYFPKPTRAGEWREQITLNLAGEGMVHLYRQQHQGNQSEGNLEAAPIGGFIQHDSATGRADKLEITTVGWRRMGATMLPHAWQGRFEVNGKPVVFRIQSERPESSHLFLKGRRQSVARGFVKIGSKSLPVFGMAVFEHLLASEEKIRDFEKDSHVPAAQKGMNWETAKKR